MNNIKKRLMGFSLVEMMLLLLITSLMLASSVTLITKKHVKVPKITMHGAYMCYMKNGRLHEEQYVGSGLRKKTKDQDVNACKFIPPAKTSYLHIQAIGGGGGGGDSGYTGGKIETFESQTEVISPFGITQGLLDLKGISTAELESKGGSLYAYAMAESAGNGGDLYYIKQECVDTCLKYRDWNLNTGAVKKCTCKTYDRSVSYSVYNYEIYPECYTPGWADGKSPSDCEGWKNGNEPDDCEGWARGYSPSDCEGWNPGCKSSCTWGQSGCNKCLEYNPDNTCKSACVWETKHEYDANKYCTPKKDPHRYCVPQWVDDAKCTATWDRYKNPHACSHTSSTGTCHGSYSYSDTSDATHTYKTSSLNVNAKDTTTKDYYNPKHMYEKKAATGTATLKVRDVKRDEQIAKAICNYGNTTKFTGVSDGVFGSFADGEVPVGCGTAAIMAAFGDDIYPLGGGTTVFTNLTTKSSKDVYGGEGIKYDPSEENADAYGQRCVNDARPGVANQCADRNNSPVSTYPKYSLITGISVSNTSTHDVSDECQALDNDNKYFSKSFSYTDYHDYTSYFSSSGYSDCSNCSSVTNTNCSSGSTTSSPCSQRKECLESRNLCSYIPAKAAGGTGGSGTKCRTNDMKAGVGLNYVGNSSVVPGVRGSDKNCTGAGYKALYTESQWRNQPSCYAENGTNALGSSNVKMTGRGTNSCTANSTAPTLGKGGRKTSTGTSVGTSGASSTQNGTTTLSGATNGSGCGDEHVGYCLKRKNGGTSENGKYRYKYTWDTNYLQYGEGGKAGQYRAMIIRSFDGVELPITLGQGGAGGAPETGNAGEDGTATIVGDIIRAEGGVGGPGGKLTPVEQLPVWYSGGTFIKGKNGTPGESANKDNFKANILNLILPIDNSVLGQWLAASGAGGDGGGSRNNCWASEWVRWFEGEEVFGKERVHAEDITCRTGNYGTAEPNATNGTSGAVLIRW